MMAQVILREFAIQVPASDDISAYLCVATTFFALAHTFRRGELIRVGLLLERLPAGAQRIAEIVALSIAAVALAYLLWWTTTFTYQSWEIEDVAQGTVPIPLWIPQLSMVLGSAVFLVAVVDELARVLRGERPTYVVLAEERLARGDFSAEV
nr:TRAP transporter small permease [Roseomonas acroporae]